MIKYQALPGACAHSLWSVASSDDQMTPDALHVMIGAYRGMQLSTRDWKKLSLLIHDIGSEVGRHPVIQCSSDGCLCLQDWVGLRLAFCMAARGRGLQDL
jgi:hypothetical protein